MLHTKRKIMQSLQRVCMGPFNSGYYSMPYNTRGILFYVNSDREEGGDDGR